MRDSVTLVEGMENVKILLQYLYMDEGNHIVVKNAIDVSLKLSMDEDGNFECINMNFPDLPPMKNYDFSISSMLAAIDQIEEQPATEFPERFKSRWEEIKTLTLANVALNKGYYGDRVKRAKEDKKMSKEYPCDGHDCFDRGNYHTSCAYECPLHHAMDMVIESGIKPKGLQDYLRDDPSLARKVTYEEMRGKFCETD